MKNVLLFVLIIIQFSCSEKNSNNKNKAKSENETEQISKIEFEEEMHDFGNLKAGEILTYSFQFTNLGESDLIINNAETDCGCIEVKFAKNTFLPGEMGIIEVIFNSAGLFGKQLKTVEIQSNSKEPKHLIIFAEVENEQIEIKN